MIDVYFVLFLVCLYVCVCECPPQNNMQMYTSKNTHIRCPLREFCSIRSCASGIPRYCAALVCVSEVIELLGVWWYYKPKKDAPSRHAIWLRSANQFRISQVPLSKVYCRSASARRFRAPDYCTLPVTVPEVIGGLAVWRHNNKNENLLT